MTSRTLRTPAAALVLAVALGGCVVSSQPVIAPAEATFDERLLGTWQEVDGPDRAVVTRGDSGTYRILFVNARDTARLAGRLGQLGGRAAMDVWPVPRERELPSAYDSLLLPAHVLVMLDIGAEEVTYAILDPDTLLRALRNAPSRPRHEVASGRVVLHGTTPELHALLGPQVGRPGALSQGERMRRAASGGAR